MSKASKAEQFIKHQVLVNTFDSGYLFGRFQTDNWTKISDGLPKKDGMYLVTDGSHVLQYQYSAQNKAFKNKTLECGITIKFWQLLPLPPRSEIGRD